MLTQLVSNAASIGVPSNPSQFAVSPNPNPISISVRSKQHDNHAEPYKTPETQNLQVQQDAPKTLCSCVHTITAYCNSKHNMFVGHTRALTPSKGFRQACLIPRCKTCTYTCYSFALSALSHNTTLPIDKTRNLCSQRSGRSQLKGFQVGLSDAQQYAFDHTRLHVNRKDKSVVAEKGAHIFKGARPQQHSVQLCALSHKRLHAKRQKGQQLLCLHGGSSHPQRVSSGPV